MTGLVSALIPKPDPTFVHCLPTPIAGKFHGSIIIIFHASVLLVKLNFVMH